MSWQAYVDTSLLGSGKCDSGAIFSVKGDSVWGMSPGFSVTPEEVKAILTGYNDSSSLYEKGVFIKGEKYVCIKAEGRSIYAKKGKEGIACIKTNQALIIAHYPEGVQPGEFTTVVEQLGDYLTGVGY